MNRVIIRGLLGAAAGFAMVSGAQAADMPVKAKAIEYVKICSAYGAGFYYIPGTDICLRVGGYVYLEFGVKGSSAVANIYETNDGFIDDTYDYMNWRTSMKVILDARQNTAYGTLRAYAVFGPTNVNHVNTVGADAAFIQFAGFTWGYTNSFFSFGGNYSIVANPAIDWSWLNVAGYTAQLGNGVTASISIEDPEGRRANGGNDALGAVNASYGGRWAPEVVGNFNVTQAWGRAQIMGALHQVKYALTNDSAPWGYAIGAGIELKTPTTGNPNNSWIVQGAWTKGAVDYTGYNSSPTVSGTIPAGHTFRLAKWNGTGVRYGVDDAVFGSLTGEDLDLTKAWSVYTAYRHYWTPALRSAFLFGYLNIDEGDGPNSSGELDVIQTGISTVWSPVTGLDLSLDLIYSKLEEKEVGGFTGKNDLFTAWTRLRRNF